MIFEALFEHLRLCRILGSLPEIRHKTAVSTITSTRDRSKTRNDENKSRSYTKKESSNKGK